MQRSAEFAATVRAVQADNTPAAIAAVSSADGTEIVTSGVADLLSQRTPDKHTLFRAYSVAKPFTALVAARLALTGALDLDEPVRRLLRRLRILRPTGEAADDVSLRQLLCHTAPIRAEHDLYVDAAVSYGELVDGGVQCQGPLPAEWAYSNDGYGVVQQVIEDTTGEPFVDVANGLMRDLGVTDGGFRWSPPTEGNVAHPYDRREDGTWERAPAVVPSVAAAGCLWLSANDLGALTGTLLARDRPWLEQLMAMCGEPHVAMPYPELRQCLGWMRRTLDDSTYLWHSGAGKGGYAELWVGSDISIAFCANGSIDVGEIASTFLTTERGT